MPGEPVSFPPPAFRDLPWGSPRPRPSPFGRGFVWQKSEIDLFVMAITAGKAFAWQHAAGDGSQ
jgi:hypothetical protein